MVFWIQKKEIGRMLLCCTMFLSSAVLFHSIIVHTDISVFSPSELPYATVVIDPGHGGEDGGAVSPGGTAESHINLAIAAKIQELFRFAGAQTYMTREEDTSICDEGLGTVRERKSSDIRNRVALVEQTENAVLLSVHQNSLPSSTVTHGAQAFWNEQSGAKELAQAIQASLNTSINEGHEKQPRRIPSTVYLMKHVTVPGVLVECGFLTNPQEEKLLQEPAYQRRVAVSIVAGYLCGISERDIS